ncbi:MAG: hypothetical protein QOH76_1259 [Thermoleophilaceae bacterium]|nr:hypothetical protein [Thermoleophilaceae bacterium]
MRELVANAAAGEGGVAVVEGPAGIGKTRLVQEALDAGAAAGLDCRAARGSELERDFAFGVARQLLEAHLTGLPARERRKLLAGAAGLALPVFPDLDQRDDAAASGLDAQHAVLHGLYWLVAKLAEERPLVMAVDDAHWADAPSLRFLAYLANRIRDLPVLLVVGLRPSEPGAPLALLDQVTTGGGTQAIAPGPLSREAARRIARSLLGRQPEQAFIEACMEVTRGNPFFLRELLGTLSREGTGATAEDAARVLESVPAGVARSVARRFARLPPDSVALARAVAVLGDDVQIDLAAQLAELDASSASAAAEALVRAEVLAAGVLQFVHPIVRSAVYSDMPELVRGREHTKASRLLADRGAGDARIALHLLAGTPREDSWAVEVLRRAAEAALARGAPDIAATYLRRALAEPPAAADRPRVLFELGRAHLAARGDQEGYGYIREAMAATAEPRDRALVALELGRLLFTQGFFPEAVEAFEGAVIELDDADRTLRHELEAQLTSLSFTDLATLTRRGGLDHARQNLASRPDATDPLHLASLGWATVASVPPARTGAELAARALAGGGLSVEHDPLVFATATAALMAADLLEPARRSWDEAADEAARRGSLPAVRFALTLRAHVLVRIGAIEAAASDVQTTLETAGDIVPGHLTEDLERLLDEVRRPLPWLLVPDIEVALERGELARASQSVADARFDGEFPELWQFNYLLYSLGRLRLAQGQAAEGIAHLRDCGRRLSRWGIVNPGFIPWRASLAPALASAGEREEAAKLAAEEIELARRFEVPRELGMGLRAAALVEGGDGAVDLLREAVVVLADSPAPLEHGRALTDLGACLRRGGHRSDAREPLRLGLDLARRCGSTVLEERAHAELIAAGARPRRLALSGWDSLTASERRVARLVTEGLTNREIAERLFVSEKTVEGHLGNVYRKLEIGSRTQLPPLVPADPA